MSEKDQLKDNLLQLANGIKDVIDDSRRLAESIIDNWFEKIDATHQREQTTIVAETVDDAIAWMNTDQAAKFLNVKKSTLYAWTSKDKIPFQKVGRMIKFRRERLIEWSDERTQQAQNKKQSVKRPNYDNSSKKRYRPLAN